MKRDIGLALSGGGFRAAAFHLGCLRALHDRGLLPRVRVMSGVSGGALVAALYAYGPLEFASFDTMATKLLAQGLHLAITRRFLTSRRGVQATVCLAALPFEGVASLGRYLVGMSGLFPASKVSTSGHATRLRHVNRTTALADVLAERIFSDRIMSTVTHPGLEVVLTACDLATGGAVRFGSHTSACSRIGVILDDVAVASAVAASAAYPALLPALEQRYRFRDRLGNECERVLLLTDGGVYDNLGLSVLNVNRDDRYTPHVYDDVEYVVACDAGQGQLPLAAPHIWPTRMARVVRIMHGRAQHGQREPLYAASSSGRLSGFVYAYLGMQDAHLPTEVADLVPRDAVTGYPTDFAAMSRVHMNAIALRGEQLVRTLLPHYCPSLG